ncbi:hypothetical protein MNBD_BACTEROID01-2952 [hydrothermal vent metagenome]|uniref:histidine kinase n=1 Tax=hydrothermal vent metagenome TaxID=652676 RepID=A0A3B0UID8_9ZZZZ
MKLLTKTNLNFLTISLFIFMFGLAAFYYLLRYQVNQNINYELEKRKNSITQQFGTAYSSNKEPVNLNEQIIVAPYYSGNNSSLSFSDTILYDNETQRYIPYRKLGFVTTFNNQEYYVQIFKSLEETDMLIVRIFLITTVLIILMIVTLLFLNRITSRNVWNAFYETIDKLNKYDINSQSDLNLNQTEVKEFDDLNRVLIKMTDKIKEDYINLKEYTENSSHELQNPLAIINAKMELLLQSGNLTEKQYQAVVASYEASNRLSRLNKTLLLLAKIENRQFPESENIDPQVKIDFQLEYFEDLITSKKINVKKEYNNPTPIKMNPFLSEILFSNLIKNAIRHNFEGGELNIVFEDDILAISNTGPKLRIEAESIFRRFNKSSNSPDSLGLGLAIVKKICDIYGFTPEYSFENGYHKFRISFKSA